MDAEAGLPSRLLAGRHRLFEAELLADRHRGQQVVDGARLHRQRIHTVGRRRVQVGRIVPCYV